MKFETARNEFSIYVDRADGQDQSRTIDGTRNRAAVLTAISGGDKVLQTNPRERSV